MPPAGKPAPRGPARAAPPPPTPHRPPAPAGHLARRGFGDLHARPVAEYRALPGRGRLAYRLFRTPLVMFGIGPLYAMVLAPRWVSPSSRERIRRSVIATDLALAALI